MYVDAHCHLERATYGDELPAILARARLAGLSHCVAVGASHGAAGAREAVALAAAHEFVYAAVGVHPHDAARATADDEAVVADLLGRPKVVALGEIGLDYHYEFAPPDVQRALFRRLLVLGRERDVPVMLHVREAHADALACLDEIGLPARGGVVHCFTAGPREAAAYLERGLYLSIPGVITFKNAEPLRAAVRAAPLARLLLETDSPYLAPIPQRGKRNEPAFLAFTAAAVGAVCGQSGDEIGRVTSDNARRLFGWPA